MPTTVLMKMLMMVLPVRFTKGRKRWIPPHIPGQEHRDGGDVADLVGDRDERAGGDVAVHGRLDRAGTRRRSRIRLHTPMGGSWVE